jgi:murein tripeptide amidase MpaA
MKLILTLAASAIFSTPALAQDVAPLPPLVPWHGASEKLIVAKNDPWITPSERDDLTTTPSFAETRAFAEKMAVASPLLKIEVFGRSPQGRDLFAIVLHKPGLTRKPVLLAQGGIHAGEIDGKDAGLMLVRDIAFRGKAGLLDKADLVLVPIFNVDGHERTSPFNRPNQLGPVSQGWRTTAQNLNLNRDYTKADAPEMQAMIALIRKYDPVLYLDLHVTDGTDHQYDVAFAFSGWDGLYAQSPSIGQWLDTHFRPAVSKALTEAGHTPGYYVNASDNAKPDAGLLQEPNTPRFSDGYGDFRRLPTVLVETHSLKPYRQRVLGTYVLVEEALKLVGSDTAALTTAIATDRAMRPKSLTVAWKQIDMPIKTIPFLGIAHETYRSPASGEDEVRWLGKTVTQTMPVFGFSAEKTVDLPVAWWVPATAADVIARLKLHGIEMEQIGAARTITLDMVKLTAPKVDVANEGHIPISAGGYVHAMRTETFPPGSVRVPSGQTLGLLAAAMLEPESAESFLAWNFFPGMLQRTEYIEGYVIAPMADAMLAHDPKLKAEFAAKLRTDRKFAKDRQARLQWFYERTPYYDDRFLLYPVGRELAPTK